MIGIFAANRSEGGEVIVVFEDATRTKVAARFCQLRQQVVWGDGSEDQFSQAGFIAPRGTDDHFGMFACACFGAEELAESFRVNGDDYTRIMAQTLADRLVGVFAELIHRDIRVKYGIMLLTRSLNPKAC